MMSDKDNNLLKSDILTVGSELSEKLNAIGVPNTFGKASEGKDNLMSIIRMAINGLDTTIEILRDYYNKSEVNTLLNGKSDTSHNHDTAYASKNHNHDDDYSDINHNHDSAYANINHNHNAVYANKLHQHDGADVILSNNNDVGTEIGTIEDDITSINGNITSINASITDINNTVNDHTTKFTNMIDGMVEQITNKQDKLISGVNIKTINNQSILGSGNIPTLSSSDVANNLTTTSSGKVLDARQGKELADLIGDAITYINQ